MKKRKHRTHREYVGSLPRKGQRFCDYNGNTGKAQLPMSQRCANLLKLIDEKSERGIWEHYLCDKVVAKLLEKGEVYKHREFAGWRDRAYTYIVSSKFPQPDKKERERREEEQQRRHEEARREIEEGYPSAEPFDNTPKKTIKWTKEKHQKLLMDALMGKADKKIVKQVTRTKTLPKKITK